MMSPVQHRVRQAARRARRLVRLYGTGWFVALVCVAAMAVGWTDYMVRFEDVGIRVICSLVLSVVVMWGFYRFLLIAWRYRCSELRAARRIEQLHPELADRLSSAVEFSREPAADAQAGSLELRRAVVSEAETVAATVDFNQCLDWRQPARAVIAAGISLAVVAGLMFMDSGMVALAAKRMLAPWAENPWPRRHVLQWVDVPTRLAVGRDFEAKLGDASGDLPEQVEIHYWFKGDDPSRIRTFQMQPLGEHLVHRLPNVTRPFRYRATGGDDHAMPWTELVLIEPPRIIEHEVTLYPPEYTGCPSRRADAGFSALTGTRATVRARTNKPLSAAMLETDTSGDNTTIDLVLDEDQCGFSWDESGTDWTIEQSGVYGFHLIDEAGLDVGVATQWDVRAVRDLPPTVSLKQPPADRVVTPSARVSLEAIVKDDLAVRAVNLHFVRSASMDQSEETVSLWSGPSDLTFQSESDEFEMSEGMQRTVEYNWDLTRLPFAKPGEWIDFYVTAVDHKSQTAESTSRRLTFISREELEDRIGRRQSKLLERMAEVLELQRKTRGRISDFEARMREAEQLTQGDMDQLKAAELNQREVQQSLGQPDDGIAAGILALLEEATSNEIDNADLVTQLRQYHGTIEALNENTLLDIEHQLIDVVKMIRLIPLNDQGTQRRVDAESRRELASSFESITQGQQHVIETLEKLLGQFEQRDNYQRLARETGELKREQENVRGRTQELRVETLTKSAHELTSQQTSDLKRLTRQQNNLAIEFGTLSGDMERVQQELAGDDPRAAARLADAREMVRQKGIRGLLRDVSQSMDRNRLGQAVDRQDSVVELLRELKDILANRRQYQRQRRLEVLRDAALGLERIRTTQEKISQKIDEADSPTRQRFQQWKQQESELGEQVEEVARQLEQESGSGEAELLDASEHLQEAAEAAAARDHPELREASNNARAALDAAQRKLQGALKASKDARRNQRTLRLRRTLREFVSRQQRIMDETHQVQQAQQDQSGGEQTPQWLRRVKTLAGNQTALGTDAQELAAGWSDVVAFEFALRQVAEYMTTAGGRLGDGETGAETIELQRRALDELGRILDALSTESPDEPSGDAQDQQPKESPDNGRRQVAEYLLEQLKLVRAMQKQVNRETELLAQIEEPWEAVHRTRQENLGRKQHRLTEMFRQLLEMMTDTPDSKTAPSAAGEFDTPDAETPPAR
ncbi:MAG: DUF4175 family protein [Planctomycetota bacterium]